MIIVILSLVLAAQGILVSPSQSGTVTGVLRTAVGTPAVAVRVAAMARPESFQESVSAAALAGIAETDEQGRYSLDNIPPGRYYIVAGRVDLPTFFPGTSEMTGGTVITITPGVTIPNIDFVMNDTSARPPGGSSAGLLGTPNYTIPIRVVVEGGGKLPVFAPGGFTTLRLTRTGDGNPPRVLLTAMAINVAGSASGSYQVNVDNLPDGYVIRSMIFGGTDVTTAPLQLTIPPQFRYFSVGANLTSLTSSQILVYLAGAAAGAAAATGTPVRVTPATQFTPLTSGPTLSVSPSTLTVTLARVNPVSVHTGARVAGRTSVPGARSIFLSGTPGTFYSDGTFEFHGVPPGRHPIVTLDNPSSSKPLGAMVVVIAGQDLDAVVLNELEMLPANVRVSAEPGPVGVHSAGTVPFAALRGRVLDEMSQQPITDAFLAIEGHFRMEYPIDSQGRFEIPRLLPRSYSLQVQAFGHANIHETVVIDDEDVVLELKTKKLY